MSCPKSSVRVVIIDDHPILRQGLAQLIQQTQEFCAVGEAEDAVGALQVVAEKKPELVLLDITLKKGDGIDVAREIKLRFPQVKILIMSMHDEALYAPRALQAGAAGYVMKAEAGTTLLEAMRKVIAGQIYVSQALSGRILAQVAGKRSLKVSAVADSLTERESEVLSLIGKGASTRQIADRLGVSVKTVESYRASLKSKLNFETGLQLTHHAIACERKDASSKSRVR